MAARRCRKFQTIESMEEDDDDDDKIQFMTIIKLLHVSAPASILRESSRSKDYKCNTRWTCKGKEIPSQAWTAPKCSRKLRLPDFKAIGT